MQKASHQLIDEYIIKAKLILESDEQCVDENILFTMAALLYHGFLVSGACGGHRGIKTGGPYIIIESLNYSDAMRAIDEAKDNPRKIEQLKSLARRQLALVELTFLKQLNLFYANRDCKYEYMLRLDHTLNGKLHLVTMENKLIDELADDSKRVEFLEKANQEFFDFGAYLFSVEPATNQPSLK